MYLGYNLDKLYSRSNFSFDLSYFYLSDFVAVRQKGICRAALIK